MEIFQNQLLMVKPELKHHGLILDEKLTFENHLNEKIIKANWSTRN